MRFRPAVVGFLGGILLCLLFSSSCFADCSLTQNPIAQENCLPGTPPEVWDINGVGDANIQGFATDISVDAGQTISFKIKTDAKAYRIDIYRVGYYQGNGARLVDTIQPSAALPQLQPDCLTDSATHLVDCGNWAVSASWTVPSGAVSGIYLGHLVRTDGTSGESHIIFVVRNDGRNSDILFQTSDETWQAYNNYGGYSLYGSTGFDTANRANKVSYNRPFNTRAFGDESVTWFFGAEYPMVRWLERNGYNVSYFTGLDAARNGNLIAQHKIYMSVGHDEYWSGERRANVEAARDDAHVNLAFFSGNEVYWKTRWESSIDGANTPYRTLVCYKETLDGAITDPVDPNIWTGTWRDARFSAKTDGGHPENALTGTLFLVNGPGSDNDGTLSIQVPASDGKMRFWRNTTLAHLAPGNTATLPAQTLGYEWDGDPDNGFRPAGNFPVSTATYSLTSDLILDAGATFGAGTATHHMTLHRAPSGALIFGAGTIQWPWGLDSNHDDPFGNPPAENLDMQQATVNLLADMGAQPTTLQTGTAATASGDTVPPSSNITWPTSGTTLAAGSAVEVAGTATDSGGGVIGGVELSVDGGATWHPATGRENWKYAWTPAALGTFTIKSRATDDSANLELPGSGISVVTVNPFDCPCTGVSSSSTPSVVDSNDGSSVELGVKFRADFAGFITGIRFYKAAANTGTHIGHLWRTDGTLLATAIFSNETSSGWQQVSFSNPVPISANTTYVASYFAPNGHYSATSAAFAGSGIDAPPLHQLASTPAEPNGVFSYGTGNTFPASSFNATNYWVDVVFIPASSMPGAPPALLVNPSTLSFTAPAGGANPPPAQTVNVYNEGDGVLSWSASSDSSWLIASPASTTTPSMLAISVDASHLAAGTYTGTVTVSASGATNLPQKLSVVLTVTNALLFSNFADGTMQGWAFSPLGLNTNWSVANSALQYNGQGHTQVYAGDSSWTDYTESVGIKLNTVQDYPGGFRGRVDPVTGAGYAVWLYPSEGLIKLFQNVAWNIDSGVNLIGQAHVQFDNTNFHTYQLSFQGNQIQVSYDGNVVITAADSTRANGLIALDVSNQVISFTNVMVTSGVANADAMLVGANSLTFSANPQSNPAPQDLSLDSSGGILAWTVATDQSWLTVSPSYGGTPATLQVSVASSALAAGTYSGNIKVVSLGVTDTTQIIPVTLIVGGGLTTQTITVSSNVPVSQTYITSFNLSATGGSSGNPVSFALDASSTACSIGSVANAGGTFTAPITMTSGTGDCVIDLNQAGNANYSAAQPVEISVAAAKANQANLTVTGPASVTYGVSAPATASGGNGTGVLTFSVGSSSGCSVTGSTVVVYDATGSCSLVATQAGDNNFNQATSAAFTVSLKKANALVTVTPYSVTYDGRAHTATGSATGVESTPANLSSLLTLTGTTHTNAGTYNNDAWTFAGNNNYSASNGTVNDSISQASSSVTVTFQPGPYVYNGTAFTATAQVSGTTVSVPVSYSGDCINVTTTNGCTATATYAGDANHAGSTGSSSITITKANAVITVIPYAVNYDGQSHTATGSATGVESTPANLNSLLTLTSTTHTAAGTYSNDVWSFAGNNNYNATSGTVNDSIAQATSTVTVTFEPGPYVYRGTAFTATAQVSGTTVSVPVSYSGDCANVTTTNGCTATATYAGDANHTGSTGSSSITITKANAKITVTGYSVTYDGQPHTATGSAVGVESTPANLSSSLTLTSTTHTNAGTYNNDAWSFAGTNNYNATSGTVNDAIAQANSKVVVSFEPGPYGYRGTAFTATAQVSGTSITVPVSYSGDCINVTTTNGCTASATYAGDANHTGSTGTASITIAKANAKITVTGYSVTYDGQPHTATGSATGVESTPANLSSLLTLTSTTHTSAGTYNNDAWSFAGNNNYNATSGAVNDSIAQATSSVTVTFEAGPYAYRGSAFTATAHVNGTSVSVPVSYTGDCINVTTTNGCTASATYLGDANHAGSTGTSSITITKANAVITVIPYSVPFDGQPHTATGSATGVESTPANLSSLLTLASTTHTSAGTYNNDAWSFAGNNNYNASSGTVNDSIAQANSNVIVTFEPGPYVYRGTAFTATAQVNGTSISVPLSYSGDCVNVTSANGCTATATYAGDANHSGSTGTSSITIIKANAKITVTGYSVTYDGQAHTAIGTALGVESTPANLTALLSLNNTTHMNAGSYKGDPWSFAGNNNYNSATGTVDDSIGQASSGVSVAFEPGPYVYRATAFIATAQVTGTNTSVPVSYSGDCINVTSTNGCTATASYSGDANHAASTGTNSITILKANANITVTGYKVTYDGQPHTATGTALGIESTPANLTSLLTLSGTTHTIAGTYNGDVWSFAGNNNYSAASGTVADSIGQLVPIITWANPADIVAGTPLSATQLNATANVNGSFSYTTHDGTPIVSGSTVLSAGLGQELDVTFTPSDTGDFSIQTAMVHINVLNTATGTNVPAQTDAASITFSDVTIPGMTSSKAIDPSTAGQVPNSYVVDPTMAYDLTTTATFSGPVQVCFTITSVTDPNVFATLRVLHGENGVLVDRTILAPDSPVPDFSTKTLCARVDSLSPFLLARVSDVTPPTIAIAAPTATSYSLNQSITASYSCTDSGSGVDSCKGTVDSGSPIDTSSAGQKTFTVTAIDKTRNTATQSVSYTVAKGSPTVNWSNPADIVYGTALNSTQLNATANVPGTFAYTPAIGTVLKAGAQTLSVTFTPNDIGDYNTATQSVTINVSKASPLITWANPSDITAGTPLSSTQLNATANAPGTFAYSPAAGTILGPGTGQSLSVTLTPTDTADYTTVTKSVLINVKASTSVSTPSSSLNPSTYGQAVTLTATVSSNAGTPTGTLQFFDGSTLLGTTTLNNGTGSVTTTAVNAGTRSITAVYGDPNNKYASSASPAFTQTVNKATATATLTFSPISQQYSDPVTFKATFPAGPNNTSPATAATFKVGTQVMGSQNFVLNSSTGLYESVLTVPLLETVAGQLTPGSKLLTATFTANPNYTMSNRTGSLGVTAEDARTYYSGPTTVSTGGSGISAATIPISYTINDITAVTGDAAWDANPGNITMAKVTFINRTTGATIATVPVTLVNANDSTIGTATYNWSVDIGTASSQTYTIGAIVSSYYTRNSTTENATITVSKP